MSDEVRLPFQRLEVYEVACDYVRVVVEAQVRDPELKKHATEAAKSAFLNLAEGLPSRSGPMRRKFFETARNSLCESVAAMHLSGMLGVVDAEPVTEAHRLANRFESMLRALGG